MKRFNATTANRRLSLVLHPRNLFYFYTKSSYSNLYCYRTNNIDDNLWVVVSYLQTSMNGSCERKFQPRFPPCGYMENHGLSIVLFNVVPTVWNWHQWICIQHHQAVKIIDMMKIRFLFQFKHCNYIICVLQQMMLYHVLKKAGQKLRNYQFKTKLHEDNRTVLYFNTSCCSSIVVV